MKPPPFSYHDPRTMKDAVGLLATLENAKVLAGGQSLMPMLNMRFVQPDHVIDLNKIEGLSYIRETTDGMEVGAMTRQRELEFSDVVKRRFPLMDEAIQHIGHRQTRNRGTIGGSLCHLDPSAELVSCATNYDAVVVAEGPDGPREIAFADFPIAYMTPSIEQNEILTAVKFTAWPKEAGYAFVEFSRRHGDFAITSAAVLIMLDGAKISRAAITIGGMGTAPVRAREVEDALVGQTAGPELFASACEHARKIEAIDDVHAPGSYRQHLATVLSRRALEKAHARMTGKDTNSAAAH